jgi:hypothetical protein
VKLRLINNVVTSAKYIFNAWPVNYNVPLNTTYANTKSGVRKPARALLLRGEQRGTFSTPNNHN